MAPPAIPADAPISSSTCWLRMPRRADCQAIRKMWCAAPPTTASASAAISQPASQAGSSSAARKISAATPGATIPVAPARAVTRPALRSST